MVPLPLDPLPEFEKRLEKTWWRAAREKRRDALAIGLGLCGLRWCEVSRLSRTGLQVTECTVAVKTGKGGIDRIIPVGPSWMTAMQAVIKLFPLAGHGRLFVSRSGEPLSHSHIHRRMRSWSRRVFGQPYSFHCLRHTAAVRMYLATKDVVEVHRMLGHSSLQWTTVYLASIRPFHEVGFPDFVKGGDRVKGLRVFDPEGRLAG